MVQYACRNLPIHIDKIKQHHRRIALSYQKRQKLDATQIPRPDRKAAINFTATLYLFLQNLDTDLNRFIFNVKTILKIVY